MAEETHHFDRRRSDTNYKSLGERVTILEDRMEKFEHDLGDARREIKSNTELTEEIHGQSAEMYEAFTTARNGVRVLASLGNGVMWVAERGKHLVIFLLGLAALVTLARTGKIPDWLLKLMA